LTKLEEKLADEHLAKASLQARRELFVLTRDNWKEAVELFAEPTSLSKTKSEYSHLAEKINLEIIEGKSRFSMFGDISNYDDAIKKHKTITAKVKTELHRSPLEQKLGEAEEVQKLWDEKVYRYFVYTDNWPKPIAKWISEKVIPPPKLEHSRWTKAGIGYFCVIPYMYVDGIGVATGIKPRTLSILSAALGAIPTAAAYLMHESAAGGPVTDLYNYIGLGGVMYYTSLAVFYAKGPLTAARIIASTVFKKHITDFTTIVNGEPIEMYFGAWSIGHTAMVKLYNFFDKKYDPETSYPIRDSIDWAKKQAYKLIGETYTAPTPVEREKRKEEKLEIKTRKLEIKAKQKEEKLEIRANKIRNTPLLNTPLPNYSYNHIAASYSLVGLR
jgi:hypothetical protein